MRAYFDHAATSPMPDSVQREFVRGLRVVGNPASTHGHGQEASDALETARETVARALGCDAAELIFTGGGTESVNLAVKGLYWARRRAGSGPVVLIADGEHHATIEAAEWLRDTQGARLETVPIDDEGRIAPETLRQALERWEEPGVALFSFLAANNEVGTIQPVAELVAVAAEHGVPTHVDAVAALGQVPLSFAESGAAAMSVSAHKIGGPVGVGALALGRSAQADALLHGGSQQRSRSGTQNVAGAIGFAAAVREVFDDEGRVRDELVQRLRTTRDRVIEIVRDADPSAVFRGARERRLPGNAHFTFPGCQGDSLVFLLDAAGVSVSVGSACQAGVAQTSHVLLAMGIPEETAAGSLRFTVGADTSEEELAMLADALPEAVRRARLAGLS